VCGDAWGSFVLSRILAGAFIGPTSKFGGPSPGSLRGRGLEAATFIPHFWPLQMAPELRFLPEEEEGASADAL